MRFPEFSEEWEKKRIADIAPLQRGFDLPTQDVEEGEYPVVYSNGILRYHKKYKCVAPGLVTGRSGSIGSFTYINDSKYWPHNTSLWVTDFNNNHPFFVYYLYQTINISQYASGSSVPTLNRNDVHRHSTHIPSLNEQIKIAALLEKIDERIATQRKIIEDLKKLKNAINNSLHNSTKEIQLLSFSELGNDYSGLTGKASDDFGSGFPYISYLNVFRNDIVTDGQFDCVKIAKSEKQNEVTYGDVLFTLSSETPTEVGVGAIYLGNTSPLYLNSFCFGVHLSDQEYIYGPYLAYFVTSQYFRRTILPFAQGSTRYNLMKSDFMKHKFHIPYLEKQKKIYNALYTLSAKIHNEEVCLNKYSEQKQFLLTQLFI